VQKTALVHLQKPEVPNPLGSARQHLSPQKLRLTSGDPQLLLKGAYITFAFFGVNECNGDFSPT
jgi:hypothetical protein